VDCRNHYHDRAQVALEAPVALLKGCIMALPSENLVDNIAAGVEPATALLKALANVDRLSILCSLIEGEKCVSDLEELLDIRQPSLSQQLARLRADSLVSTRREGKVIYYSIDSVEVERVVEVLHELYCN